MHNLLAVACASITGISLGIVLNHKQSLGSIEPELQHTANTLHKNGSHYYTSALDSETLHHSTPVTDAHAIGSSQVERKLNKLIELQNTMRNQQSELNRELNAVQFRLDTHSASFRPLQSERETEALRTNPSPFPPLLPPRQ